MLILMILFPLLLAGIAVVLPWYRIRSWLLPLGGAVQFALAVAAVSRATAAPARNNFV